jgi:ankyrin repeat protein
MTAVTVAADQGQAEILDFLLRKGADANAADKEGRTPLLWAAAFANHQTVQTLLAYGAHVNAQSHLGKTSLMLAAGDTEELGSRGNAASVRVLLAAGADVTLKDHHGDTAQTLARKRVGKDAHDIIELLTLNRAVPSGTPLVDDPNEEKSTANWP